MNLPIIKGEKRLSNNLTSFLKGVQRLVVIGMGNELRADDGVGLEVVRGLKPYVNDKLTVFEGHMMPESFIGLTCAIKPTHLLIVDAAELHEKLGEWRLLAPTEIDDGLFTTHSIPATEVTKEVHRRCGTKIAFLGIQPKNREIELQISKECCRAVHEIVTLINQAVQSAS